MSDSVTQSVKYVVIELLGQLKISKLIDTPNYLEVVIRHACEVLSGDVHSLILRGEVSKSHLSLEKQ